ncbi:MAG TPA: hypothetical protein VN836_06715 [Verrucomicrobiae bacterium]|nr:hypothetical protein [Verrucomicrobiae bacterium]
MTSTSLMPPAWSFVTSSLQTTGAVLSVTLPLNNNASSFYRLQSN